MDLFEIMKDKKIGLMGCGVVARQGHLPALSETSGLSLHAVYDPSAEAVDWAREKIQYSARFHRLGFFFPIGD
jgi:predicted dehydrogenase